MNPALQGFSIEADQDGKEFNRKLFLVGDHRTGYVRNPFAKAWQFFLVTVKTPGSRYGYIPSAHLPQKLRAFILWDELGLFRFFGFGLWIGFAEKLFGVGLLFHVEAFPEIRDMIELLQNVGWDLIDWNIAGELAITSGMDSGGARDDPEVPFTSPLTYSSFKRAKDTPNGNRFRFSCR